MKRSRSIVGSVGFFLAAPTTVAGIVPAALTRWQMDGRPGHLWPLRLVGALLVLAGVAVVVPAFVRFVTEGHGTPAPVAPTDALVVGGLYRWVRNPMYVAVVAIIVGQALLLNRTILLVDAVITGAVMAAFVHWYEEPVLAARYGSAYDDYRRRVPAWHPRLHHRS